MTSVYSEYHLLRDELNSRPPAPTQLVRSTPAYSVAPPSSPEAGLCRKSNKIIRNEWLMAALCLRWVGIPRYPQPPIIADVADLGKLIADETETMGQGDPSGQHQAGLI